MMMIELEAGTFVAMSSSVFFFFFLLTTQSKAVTLQLRDGGGSVPS